MIKTSTTKPAKAVSPRRVAKAQKHADKIAAEMAPQKAALALLNAKPDATEAPALVASKATEDQQPPVEVTGPVDELIAAKLAERPTEAELSGPDDRPAFLRSEANAKAEAPNIEAPAKAVKKSGASRESALSSDQFQRVVSDSKPADASKPINGVCLKKEDALAEARATHGPDAQPNVDFGFKKTPRGEYVWGPLGSPGFEKVSNGIVTKAKTAETTIKASKPVKAAKPGKGEAKPAKAAKAAKPAKAAESGDKAPRAGSNSEVILRQLTSTKGLTRKSIEDELQALRGAPVSCAPRSTALRLGEAYGYRLNESKDKDGTERFFLVRA